MKKQAAATQGITEIADQEVQATRKLIMKNRTAEEILSYTFKHLETVLNGKSNEQDGFAHGTAVRADTLYTQPKRGRPARGSSEIGAEEKAK